MKLAIVGATGLVGCEILQVLSELNIPISELILVASQKSVGKEIQWQNQTIPIVSIETAFTQKPDFAIFSAGSAVSLEYAEKFAAIGTTVIDNSSAWRMSSNIPLIVPEINGTQIGQSKIIANPNCSTIQLVMVLYPILQVSNIKRVIVSTYQAVTGTGKVAVDQLTQERASEKTSQPAYPYPIDLNCIPQCDIFLENGYTREETKIIQESRKILNHPNLAITATAVRVPVVGGHSESVNISLEKPISIDNLRAALENFPGVVVYDNPQEKKYPMPIMAHQKNDVFVGRIRIDESEPNTFNLWIVADNLRKGAATNAVQILQSIIAMPYAIN
ncbi:MAG: aspartate-semialdehyde dehydrogenase [Bacteroidia bacterium]|nr:aspartate-semialdehyde dehydrogenase [Bacteroidia bacterium]